MSDRPWWKRPPKRSPDDVIAERTQELENSDLKQHKRETFHRSIRPGSSRSVIYSQKMTIPKGKRRKR